MKEPAAAYLDHRVWFRFGNGVGHGHGHGVSFGYGFRHGFRHGVHGVGFGYGVGFRHCLVPGDDSRDETQTRFALDRCRRDACAPGGAWKALRCRRDACAPFGLPVALSRRSSSYREAV